jgi:class 3 adenylate cyclase/tetratricopeptide (TPR) repeat protein
VGVVCVSCGAAHPAGARFCSSCGAPLHQICRGCGAEQPAAATFCSACGIALREDARRVADTAYERQERRVVTVLFADLAGSTALGERLDPEELRELQGELFELVDSEVEKFGGTSEKFVGDAVLAVFGIPQAHEDDPERAVRAALAAQERFGAFAARVRARHGADVGLRVGVNTGEVVAGREAAARGELMVSGDAVNVAARLQQGAEPGDVLVGRRTHAATSRTISYAQRDAVHAKGKQSPVPAWVAISPHREWPATVRGVGGVTAPMVGRDEELAVLAAVAARARREGAPQFVTLFGQAGVGKSRLLAELVDRLPGARLLQGRCIPYGEGVTYWPLAEAAKTHAGVLETDPAEVALAKLRTAVESVVPEEHVARVLEAAARTIGFSLPDAPTVADPLEAGRRLEDGWARFVAALGRDRLTIVAVEDVHWASSALLDLLEQLAERLEGTQVVLVCTARPEFLEARPTWGAGRQNATTLSLAPLSASASEELVVSLLGKARVPDGVRQRVLESAEGNPFFLEEMLNMLIDERALERRDGEWAWTDRLAEVSIPDSVHGVIAARIDLLGAAERDALRRCSVVGRIFWPAAVAVDEHVVASLSRSGLVSDHPDSVMAGMREFAFKHALTRDVAYGTLPRPERRLLHRRVAEWIQDVAPDRGVEAAELAAYHYRQAIAYGEDDAEMSRRAFELLLRASEAAFERAALEAARTQLEQALELAADDRQRARAQLGSARLDQTEGHHEEALRRLDIVDRLAGPDDRELRSEALGWRSRVCWLTGRWDEALASSNAAVTALEGLPESRQLARALARRSQIEMLKHHPDAIDHASEAVAVARRVGDSFAEVNARINLVSEQATRGVAADPDELFAVVRLARDTGAYEEAYRAIVNFIWSALGYLPVDRIELVEQEARRLVAEVPAPHSIGAYLQLTDAVMLLAPAGRWAEAEALVAEYRDGPELVTVRLLWLSLTGGLALRRGDMDAAGARLGELRSIALASREPQRIVPMACVVLPWLMLLDERDELRSLAAHMVDSLDAQWPSVLTIVPIVRTLAAAGEPDLLARVTESVRRTPYVSAKLETSLAAAEGLLAHLEGRFDRAIERLSTAAETERAMGYLYDAACLELDLAAAHAAAGNATAAEELRERACALLERLGCVNAF